jgi:hypothetical protein
LREGDTSIRARIADAALAIALVVVSGAGTSCDPIPPISHRIGVTLRDGNVTALYVLCPGELATDVRAYAVQGVVVGDKDDELLWRITARDGVDMTSFPVGSVPSGFVERKSLDRPLPKSRRLSVTVWSTNQKIATRGFKLNELRPGLVVSDTPAPLALDQFFSRARNQCR